VNELAAVGDIPGVAGEMHGRPTRRLDNGHCWIEALSGGGPRIVGFGLSGGPNVLAETPDSKWDGGHGEYELVGGHRLWFAPESPDCSYPDSTGLTVEAIPGGLRLVGAVQPPTGLRKSIEIVPVPGAAAVNLRHELRNEGDRTLEVAAWPITQLKLGGVASVDLPMPGLVHLVNPNQVLVLWPYSLWTDPRLSIGQRLTVTATPADPFKVGCLSWAGTVSYLRGGVRFLKTFEPAAESTHADFGCNVEIYADGTAIELETLGPLVKLEPGDTTVHDERWDLLIEG
jgi:hypothetical protein